MYPLEIETTSINANEPSLTNNNRISQPSSEAHDIMQNDTHNHVNSAQETQQEKVLDFELEHPVQNQISTTEISKSSKFHPKNDINFQKRLAFELENQKIYSLTSTLPQVYIYNLEKIISARLLKNITSNNDRIENICTSQYQLLFNSSHIVAQSTDRVRTLSKKSQYVNRELRSLAIDHKCNRKNVSKIRSQQQHLKEAVRVLELTTPILEDFSRIIDLKNNKKHYFALKTILKVKKSISNLPGPESPNNLQELDYIQKIKDSIPGILAELKSSCENDINHWLETVHEMTLNSKDLLSSDQIMTIDTEDYVPLFRARHVFETLEELDSVASNFKKKRDQQREYIHNITRQEVNLRAQAAKIRNSENGPNSGNVSSTNSPDETSDLNLAIQQLAQTFTFFHTERLLSYTIPEFSDISMEKYRQSIQFGVIQRLKQARFELSSYHLDSSHLGLGQQNSDASDTKKYDPHAPISPENTSSPADSLHDNIIRFLDLEENFMPSDLRKEIESILYEIREKGLKNLMDKYKDKFIKILKNDSYTLVSETSEIENDLEMSGFVKMLENCGMPGIDTSNVLLNQFTPMVPKITIKIIDLLNKILNKRSAVSRDISVNLKFMLDASSIGVGVRI